MGFEIPQDLKTCWGCGFTAPFIDRAHVRAVCDGGTNEPENMVLLCRMCHTAQETVCITDKGRENFVKALEDGVPFMKARAEYLLAQVELTEFQAQ